MTETQETNTDYSAAILKVVEAALDAHKVNRTGFGLDLTKIVGELTTELVRSRGVVDEFSPIL